MKRFVNVVALAAFLAGSTTGMGLPPAAETAEIAPSAVVVPYGYPGNCSTSKGIDATLAWGQAKCTSGTGSFRVVVQCSFAGQAPGTHYGPWRGPGASSSSFLYCPFAQDVVKVSYQRTT